MPKPAAAGSAKTHPWKCDLRLRHNATRQPGNIGRSSEAAAKKAKFQNEARIGS
jgi:hypothetical protein